MMPTATIDGSLHEHQNMYPDGSFILGYPSFLLYEKVSMDKDANTSA
jgi:hypothetical protein